MLEPSPLSAYSHRHNSFVTVFEDITMRKQSETQLQDVTHKLELAQELGRSGWWEYDVVNEKAKWPDVSYALFGHDPADTTFDYERFQQLIHPEYRADYETQLKKLLDEGIAEFLYPITQPDGQTRWIWTRGEAEYNENGKPVRLFGILQDITDRKRLEEAHRKSTQHLFAIYNTVPVGILLVKDRIVLEANPRMTQLLGYETAKIIGQQTRRFYIDDEEWKRIGDDLQSGLATRNLVSLDARVRHKDGSPKYVLMTCSRLSDESPSTILAALQDITERKEMEDALKASEGRFRALIEASAQIVWSCDPKGEVTEDSPSWRAYTGQSYEQWRGYGYADAIHPKDRETVIDRWHEGLKQGVPVTNEYRLMHHTGQWRWCLARAVPIKDSTGEIVSWVGMNADIHDRWEAENALRESEKKFHQAMVHAAIGMAIVSPDGHWVDVNPSLCRIAGYTREELLAMDFRSITHPDDIDADVEYAEQLLSGERSTYQLEKRYIHKDGHIVWIQLNVALVRDDDQKPQYFIGQIQDITQNKIMSERLKTLLDMASDGIHVLDEQGNIVEFSDSFARMLGYTAEETARLNVADWEAQIPGDELESTIQELFKTSSTFETRHRRKDGSIVEVEINAKSIVLDGRLFLYASSRDISERKEIEKALRQSEAKFRQLFQVAAIPLCHVGHDGVILAINSKFIETFGYDKADIPTLDQWREKAYPDPDYRQWVIDSWEAALQQATKNQTSIKAQEYQVTCKNGDVRSVLIGGSTFEEFFLATFVDITERKTVERSLRYYEKIASTVDTLLSLVDRDGIFLQVNDALAGILGRKREEIIGRSMAQIADSENFARMKPQIKRCLAGETVSQEMWIDWPDGSKRFFHIIRYPMFDDDGTVYAVAGVGHDMTETYQASQALTKVNKELIQANEALQLAKQTAESANRAKSIFLSNMSHELRTPLNAILGYTQILGADETFGEKQKSGIQTIYQAGEHLLMIINDVLDMSKIEAGKLQLVPSKIQLLSFFENIIDFFKYRAREKGLSVTLETDQPLCFAIKVDELRLRQIIFNLLSNAIKFTHNGYCRLSVEAAGSKKDTCRLKITVEDSGVGIPKDQQDEVFEPFKQVGERLQYKEGSGLGLAISRQLVDLMGGELVLSSPVNTSPTDGQGVGSRFSFSIEAQVVEAEIAISPQSSRKVIGYKHTGKAVVPIKILIVDDKISNRAVLHDTLNPLGFATQEAEDGSTVTEICLKAHPDLILMDLRMPNVDGFSAMNQLKHHDELKNIPVVAVTASIAEFETLEKRCIQHGFKGFILKPFVTSDLLELIAGLLPITLIYQKTNEQGRNDFSKVEVPPVEVVTKLSDSLSKGDIEGILEHAEVMGEIENGRYQDFSQKVRALANDFKFSALEKLISSIEGKDD